jgi:hypothetical protein
MKCDLCDILSWIIVITINYISKLCHFMSYGLGGQVSVLCGSIGGFYLHHYVQNFFKVLQTPYPVGTEDSLFRV